jgi:NAD(P)-dependent dehydrogenase (short-subunit alcohol dehydrogenase family)
MNLYHDHCGGHMKIDFSGQIVAVAGGTGGLGMAVSLAFLSEGAKTVVTYRKEDEFLALKDAAGSNKSFLEGYSVDVTDQSATAEFISRILADHGKLDTLVNTVGAYAGGTKLWDLNSDVLNHMLALNLNSGFALSRAALPAMLRAGHGSIVNVAAKAAFDHGAGAGAYAASKAAAVALMDSLAGDCKGTGVRVNSILPSIIDTAANRKAMPDADFATWPKPEDIATVVLFLCSDSAKTIHGAAIPVYGNG